MKSKPLTEDQKSHPTYRVLEDLLDIQECDFVIAGGSAHALVRDQNHAGDFDLFFFEYAQYEKMVVALITMSMHDSGLVKKTQETKYAITFEVFGNIVQLIKTIFPVPGTQPDKELQVQSIFNSFDLSVCCYAIDRDNLYYNQIYVLSSPENIIIQLHAVHNYARTMSRIVKYASRGCEIELNQFLALIDNMRNNLHKVNMSLQEYNFDNPSLVPDSYADPNDLPF